MNIKGIGREIKGKGYLGELYNYIMIDGTKIPISDETADNLRKSFSNTRPRANIGKEYWYLRYDMTAYHTTEARHEFDNDLYELGNYFLSKEDAEKMAEKFKELLRSKQ